MFNVFFLLFNIIGCWHVLQVKSSQPLRVIWEWEELTFVFPNEKAKQDALHKGYYVPDPIHNVPLDVDVYYSNGYRRTFISIPRFDWGRPMTLGTLDKHGRVHAYPSYVWHDNQGGNCDGLTSVFRTAIDKCNRLWVLDSGKIGDKIYCKPQILAFNLNTDQLVYRLRFNHSSYTEQSLYITPVVDVRGENCDDVYVYAADARSYAIGVVSVKDNLSWRVTHRLFYPYPDAGKFVVDGVNFDIMDGLFGLALSPYKNGDRTLYFHPLASYKEGAVLTSYLQNSNFINESAADPDSVQVLPGERSSQSGAEAMDSKGILYFGLMDPPSIWCWNSNTEYDRKNLHRIMVDEETLQFASGVKVIVNEKGEEELWVTTSSFQRFMDGSMSADQVNFRVSMGLLSRILETSPCLLSSW